MKTESYLSFRGMSAGVPPGEPTVDDFRALLMVKEGLAARRRMPELVAELARLEAIGEKLQFEIAEEDSIVLDDVVYWSNGLKRSVRAIANELNKIGERFPEIEEVEL